MGSFCVLQNSRKSSVGSRRRRLAPTPRLLSWRGVSEGGGAWWPSWRGLRRAGRRSRCHLPSLPVLGVLGGGCGACGVPVSRWRCQPVQRASACCRRASLPSCATMPACHRCQTAPTNASHASHTDTVEQNVAIPFACRSPFRPDTPSAHVCEAAASSDYVSAKLHSESHH